MNPHARLKRQLELLWKHCRDFDNGNDSSGIEIATRLRVILHSTTSSTSAIRHLGGEQIRLLSTANTKDSSEKAIVAEGGLTIFRFNGWSAALDDAKHRNLVEYPIWWNDEVVAIYDGVRYTRNMIVKDTANQDDGAHIVEKQKGRLRKLTDGPWQAWTTDANGNKVSVAKPNQHFQYLRQIAYELLHSEELLNLVDPGFRLQSDKEFKESQEAEKRERAKRLLTLYETAKDLSTSSLYQESRAILLTIVDELDNSVDEFVVRVYLLAKWSIAGSYEKTDPVLAREHLENLIGCIEQLSPSAVGNTTVIDIYVRARYYVGLMYAKSGVREISETHWNYVQDICAKNMIPSDTATLSDKAEPISYFLQSANGIAVHALNRGEYGIVETQLDCTLDRLRGVSEPLLREWDAPRIASELGPDHGQDIVYHTFKALKNLSLAKLLLGKGDEARTLFDETISRFGPSKSESIKREIEVAEKLFTYRQQGQ